MKDLKSIKVNFAGAKILTREEVREVMGGDGGGQCGNFPDCLNGASCVASSGPCINLPGTCGTTSATQSCTCAVVC